MKQHDLTMIGETTNMEMFTYEPHVRTQYFGKEFWKVLIGKKIVAVTSSEEKAISMTSSLNADPWFFDRGQTRKERYSL